MKRIATAMALGSALAFAGCSKTDNGDVVVQKPVVGTVTDTLHPPKVTVGTDTHSVVVPRVQVKKDTVLVRTPTVDVRKKP
ncbi:MAG: hypothetical protein M3081_01735 [Gemmatimonadota bacterium]|nr:hypothetical protein [Gemmatimonadota bacterium]